MKSTPTHTMKLNKSKQIIAAATSLAMLSSAYGAPKDTPVPSGETSPAQQTNKEGAQEKTAKDTIDSLCDAEIALMKKQVDILGTVKDTTSAHKAAKSLDKQSDQFIAVNNRLIALSPSDAQTDRYDQKIAAAEKSMKKDWVKHMRFISRKPELRTIIGKAMRDHQIKRTKAESKN